MSIIAARARPAADGDGVDEPVAKQHQAIAD